MRYAVLRGDMIDNVIECEPENIAAHCAALGATGYALADPAGELRAAEPGGKISNASAAKGAALELPPGAPGVAIVREAATSAGDRAALEKARADAAAELAAAADELGGK